MEKRKKKLITMNKANKALGVLQKFSTFIKYRQIVDLTFKNELKNRQKLSNH